jgi:CRISPR-associated protein Csb2
MQALVETMAASPPAFRLPTATLGHTRHYMPVKGWKRGVQKTSLVIDAFVRPHGPLGVLWPADLSVDQHDLLGRLVDRLGYLGRAESRVKARVVSVEALPLGSEVSPQRRAPDDEPVRLLAPVPSTEYATWRSTLPGAPEKLLAALQIDTATLQKEGWSSPPGSREIVYWRPADAVAPQTPDRTVTAGGVMSSADTALFALATDRKRDVLPLMERTLPTMGLFRQALLSKVGKTPCPELSGKDDQGQRLQDEHRHAHFLPLSLDGRSRGRVDHVLLHAPMGLGYTAQRALRRLRKTWAKGSDDVAVTLVGLGDIASFRTVAGVPLPELGRSATWESRTPFIPPRFLKPRGKDSLDGQVRAELRHRHLPDLVVAPVVTLPTEDSEAGLQARSLRHFVRRRQNSGAPGPPPGLFHLTLTFETPVEGPLCLGWGCHFGLGLFVPAGGKRAATDSS